MMTGRAPTSDQVPLEQDPGRGLLLVVDDGEALEARLYLYLGQKPPPFHRGRHPSPDRGRWQVGRKRWKLWRRYHRLNRS